jgi:hypothetical protein
MKVRVIRVFRVPDCDTRITRNKFGFCKLLPEIPKQNSGFGYFRFGFGFGYFGFGFRVTGFLPSPNRRWHRRSRRRRNLLWLPPPQHRRRQPPAHQHRTSERRPPKSAPAGPHSRSRHENENGTVPEHEYRPHGVRRIVQPMAQGGHGHDRPAHGATDTRAADGQPRSAPAVGGGTESSARAAQTEEPDTRQLPAPRTANAPLPRSLREGAGRRSCGGRPRPASPSSPARMMKILQAEGGAEAAARLASPHHRTGGHHPR